MKASPSVEWLSVGSVSLALHCWQPESPRGVLYYIHGIQSHAGWLFETGPMLAERSITVYALDRRGCGLSGGERSHVDRFETWLADYAMALRLVRSRHRELPLTVLGQSMGATILAGLIASGSVACDALVFCAPALNQLVRVPEERRAAVQLGRQAVATDRQAGLARLPIPLRDEQYTSDPRYLTFMRDDPLMGRESTLQAYIARFDLEEYYLSSGPWQLPLATALVTPRTDSCVDSPAARQALRQLTRGEFLDVEFPVDNHYLEFSSARERYATLLAAYVSSRGFSVLR